MLKILSIVLPQPWVRLCRIDVLHTCTLTEKTYCLIPDCLVHLAELVHCLSIVEENLRITEYKDRVIVLT